MIREAQRAIIDREARLLLLGTPEQFGAAVPDGMTVIPISCQSEGALEVYIEPVLPTPHLVVVGRSPMAQTLADLSRALGWRAAWWTSRAFSAPTPTPARSSSSPPRAMATRRRSSRPSLARPAYVGLVASRKRGEAVLGYLADRGCRRTCSTGSGCRSVSTSATPRTARSRSRSWPSSCSSGPPGRSSRTQPRWRRKRFRGKRAGRSTRSVRMTVAAGRPAFPFELDGTTYYFCCAGCREAFEKDPTSYLTQEARC